MSDPTVEAKPAHSQTALTAAQSWLARDGKVALATVIDTWGSSPVPVGGQMAIAATGEFEGSVSGGCVEGDVIAAAEDALASGKPETLTFGVADETAWSVGLPCGGRITVRVEQIVGPAGSDYVCSAVDALGARRGLVAVTRLADGARSLYREHDAGLPDYVVKRFRSARSGLVETEGGQVFVQALVPPARLIVIGATHIGQVLCDLARTAGYPAIVIDPRSAFATEARFPGSQVIAEWPQDALPRIGLDAYTAVAVVAHVEHIDDEALKLALSSKARYVGALGSKRNHMRRVERLKSAGITDAEIGRIASPIGIDIGAETPAEIALSILAEIVRSVRGEKAVRKQQS